MSMSTATLTAPRLIVDLDDASVLNTIKNALKLMKGVGSVKVEKPRTPKMSEVISPSGDTWWDDPENYKMVMEGLDDVKAGRVVELSMDQIHKILSV